jgi:hypothetical protein
LVPEARFEHDKVLAEWQRRHADRVLEAPSTAQVTPLPPVPQSRKASAEDRENRAIALLVASPEITDADISRRLGTARSTVSRMTKLQRIRESLRQGRNDRTRGYKDKDGKVDAYQDDEEDRTEYDDAD